MAAKGAIALLGGVELPLEIGRVKPDGSILDPNAAKRDLCFRFCFNEIPFRAEASRCGGRPVLSLTGDLGYLPFTIEGSRRRRRLRRVLASAQRHSGLRWDLTPAHQIQVAGEIDLDTPLTHSAVIAGAVTLLLRARPYLDLAVAVGGED